MLCATRIERKRGIVSVFGSKPGCRYSTDSESAMATQVDAGVVEARRCDDRRSGNRCDKTPTSWTNCRSSSGRDTARRAEETESTTCACAVSVLSCASHTKTCAGDSYLASLVRAVLVVVMTGKAARRKHQVSTFGCRWQRRQALDGRCPKVPLRDALCGLSTPSLSSVVYSTQAAHTIWSRVWPATSECTSAASKSLFDPLSLITAAYRRPLLSSAM